MAEIIANDGGGKHGKKRAKKGHVHIDMTPMVDLAFLLLTFFILSTTLSKPKTMEIVYPKDKDIKEDERTKIKDDLATTVLLGDNPEDVFFYYGKFKPDTTELESSDLSKDGLRKVFFDRNKIIIDAIKIQEERLKKREINDSTFKALRKEIKADSLAPFVIIKTLDSTQYKSVIDVIDDLNIANIGKYAIQDMAETEKIAVRQTITGNKEE